MNVRLNVDFVKEFAKASNSKCIQMHTHCHLSIDIHVTQTKYMKVSEIFALKQIV